MLLGKKISLLSWNSKWNFFLSMDLLNKKLLVSVCVYGLQAIKGILKEDFIGENEIPSETLLYKNLWLEAEAALCSISYRARFNRMKIEMEKLKSDNVKGWYATSKPAIFYYTYSNFLGLKYEVIHAKVRISK